ncbi:MAG: hypothetical protein E6K70_23940, partial [Planctomycetota bacterium]
MPVLTICYHCDKKFEIPETELGQLVRCPACKGLFTTQAATPILSVEPVLEQGFGVSSRGNVQPARQLLLRTIVLACGLLGAAACGALGFLWWSAQSEMKEQVELARLFMQGDAADPKIVAQLKEFDNREKAYPLLFVAASLGVFGGILGFMRRGVIGGLLMLLALAGPTFYFPKSLVFTALRLAGGLLCFLIRSPQRAMAAAEKAVRTGRQPSLAAHVLGLIGACICCVVLVGYSAFLGYALYSARNPTAQLRAEGAKGGRPGQRGQDIAQIVDSSAQRNKTARTNAAKSTTGRPGQEAPEEKSGDAFRGEIEHAGGDVKLVKLDLSPAGLDVTMDVPQGSQLKESYGDIKITKDAHFSLKVNLGRESFASEKASLTYRKPLINSSDTILYDSGTAQKPSCTFVFMKTLGYQDIVLANNTYVDDKAVTHNQADCLLMIRCARTLARKTPPPTDRAAALQAFKTEESLKENEPGEVRLNQKATDATLALVENDPTIRLLDLRATKVTSAGFIHLKRLTG